MNTENKEMMQQILIDWPSTTQREQAEFAENFSKWQTLVLLQLMAATASKNRLIMFLAFAIVVLVLSLFEADTSTSILVTLGAQLFLFGASHIFEARVKTATATAEVACYENMKTLAKKYPVL